MRKPAPGPFLEGAGGILAFCAMDAVVKYVSRDNDVVVVVFGRYLTGSAIALAVWWWRGRTPVTRAMLLPHLARGCLIAVSALLFYWSLHICRWPRRLRSASPRHW